MSRQLTSAIPGLSVADVRRNLAEMRKMWEDDSEVFSTATRLSFPYNQYTYAEFALKFSKGLNEKRHRDKNSD